MYRAICGTYVNSSPAGGPSSHPTPGRGEGVPCTPQANGLDPAATSTASYSLPTSPAAAKFTGEAPAGRPWAGATRQLAGSGSGRRPSPLLGLRLRVQTAEERTAGPGWRMPGGAALDGPWAPSPEA